MYEPSQYVESKLRQLVSCRSYAEDRLSDEIRCQTSEVLL